MKEHLKIHGPLLKACLDRIDSYRPEKPKGAIAEGYVGLILDSCSGQLNREPDFSGKRPDYEWTVAPQSPGSYRFIVEVVYLDSDESSVARVKCKVSKYKPLTDHQYYVVAAVYEEGLDISEIQRPCMPRVLIDLAIDTHTGKTRTNTRSITQEYTTGHASLLWLIPFPQNISEGRDSQTMTIAQILSENARELPTEIFTWNLESSPGMTLPDN